MDQHWPNRRVNDLQRCAAKSVINHLKKYLCFFFFPQTKLYQMWLVKIKCFKATVFFKFYLYIFWPLIQSYKSRHAVRRSECELEHSGNISRVGTVNVHACACVFMHSGTRQVYFSGQNNPRLLPSHFFLFFLLLPRAWPIRQKGNNH